MEALLIKLCPVEWRPAGAAIIITLMMDMQRYNNILETRSASPRDFRKKSTATCNTYLLSQRNVALRVALIGKSEIISRIIAIAKCLRRVMSEIRREREREGHENSSTRQTLLSLWMWSDYPELQWSRWWRRWSWFKDVHFASSSLSHIFTVRPMMWCQWTASSVAWQINFVRRCTGCCCCCCKKFIDRWSSISIAALLCKHFA